MQNQGSRCFSSFTKTKESASSSSLASFSLMTEEKEALLLLSLSLSLSLSLLCITNFTFVSFVFFSHLLFITPRLFSILLCGRRRYLLWLWRKWRQVIPIQDNVLDVSGIGTRLIQHFQLGALIKHIVHVLDVGGVEARQVD